MLQGCQAHDYAMERRLCQIDPALNKRFTDAVFALQFNLSKYQLIFPEYTDHSSLHFMDVINFCNQLIGDQIDRTNADELYILLSACYQWAIQMVSRGHRGTDLMDERAYPRPLRMPGGNSVCLPYLTALIRLSDEIDVARRVRSDALCDHTGRRADRRT